MRIVIAMVEDPRVQIFSPQNRILKFRPDPRLSGGGVSLGGQGGR